MGCEARAVFLDDTPCFDMRCFTELELLRAQRFRCNDARELFLHARVLARSMLAERLDIDPRSITLAQRCPTCGSVEHGCPEPQYGLYVSWAHTTGAVYAAIDATPVGADVELIDAFAKTSDGVVALLCTAYERTQLPTDAAQRMRALARIWTVKEALIKVGAFELDTMKQFEVGVHAIGRPTWHGSVAGWSITSFEQSERAFAVASSQPARQPVF